MLNENSTEAPVRYSKFAKTMHWGFVLLFAYGVFKQVDNLSELADPSLFRLEIVFAGIFILLLIIRFIYAKKTQQSALPEDTSKMGHTRTSANPSKPGIAMAILLILRVRTCAQRKQKGFSGWAATYPSDYYSPLPEI